MFLINVNEFTLAVLRPSLLAIVLLTNVHGRNCGYGASAPSNGIDVGYSAVTHVLKCQRGWNGSNSYNMNKSNDLVLMVNIVNIKKSC